jgi:putative oxidoreductase
MSIFDSASPKWSSRVLSVLRIVAALMLMQHGAQKMFGFPVPMTPPMPYELASLNGVAGLLEFGGGLLLLLGLLTRPVAFLVSGELAVAYFLRHAPHGFWPIANRGELAALFSFVFLYFAFAGGGPWSIDAIFSRHAQQPDDVRVPAAQGAKRAA